MTALREKMRKFQSGQKSRRAALASSADKAKHTLSEHVASAERVLALGAMARKKENERELVLPFARSSSEADQLDAEVGIRLLVVSFKMLLRPRFFHVLPFSPLYFFLLLSVYLSIS